MGSTTDRPPDRQASDVAGSLGRAVETMSSMYVDMERYAGANVTMSIIIKIGGVLEKSAVETAVNALSELSPRFRQCIGGSGFRRRWTPIRHQGSVNYIVLPDLDQDRLLKYCSDLQEEVFADASPLWQAYYLVPRDDDAESALLVRVHHSLGDGLTILSLFSSAFGVDTEPRYWVEAPPRGRSITLANRIRPGLGYAQNLVHGLWRAAASRPHRAAALSELATVRRQNPTRDGKHTGRKQTLKVVDKRPRSEWHELARLRGGRVNDLFISVVAQIIHDFWRCSGITSPSCTVAVPVDRRNDTERGTSHAVQVQYIALTPEQATTDSLRPLSGRLVRQLRETANAPQEQSPVMRIINVLPAPIRASLYTKGSEMTDALASNVGEVPTLQIAGRPVKDFMAFAGAMGSFATFVLLHYGDDIVVCADADRRLVPDVSVLWSSADQVIEHTFRHKEDLR